MAVLFLPPWLCSMAMLHGYAPSVPQRISPVRCVRDDMSPTLAPEVDRSAYVFGTVEPHDMSSCIEVLMQGFYKDILTLAANEFSEDEMQVLRPTLTRFNGGLKWLTRLLLTYEAGKRLGATLSVGGFDRPATRGDGLMIAMQHRESGSIVGVVELSEQPCDGKVPGDVRLPWAPKQREVSTHRPEPSTALRPHSSLPVPNHAPWVITHSTLTPVLCSAQVAYICNLAVLNDWRGRGVGSALLQACEGLVSSYWSRSDVYLHASTAQERLLAMYRSRGYVQLPDYDQPDWVLAVAGREATTYHRKEL